MPVFDSYLYFNWLFDWHAYKVRELIRMDATQYGESDYVTAELVKASKSKKAVVVGDAKSEETDFGQKLRVPVEIDGKKKTYSPNKDSVKNIIGALGSETKGWLGKTLNFSVVSVMGKDSVIATVQK